MLNRLAGLPPSGVRRFRTTHQLKNGRRGLLLALSLALSLVVAGPAPARAATPTRPAPTAAHRPPAQALPPDRATALPRRRPDAARLRALATQRTFRYIEPEASTDAWEAFWARLWRRLGHLLTSPAGRFAGKYGAYAAMVAALAFAVLKLLQVDVTGVLGRAGRRGPLAYATAPEDIHTVDFATRIAEAEATGNYRLATRLGYLEVLKHLTDAGHLHWQPDKTNHAYLGELAAGPLREGFRAATREFEYVWYGEWRLTAALYAQARARQRALGTAPAGRPAAPSAPSSSLPA